MLTKKQRGFSKVTILIVVLAVIAGGVVAWQYRGSLSQQMFSCGEDGGCVLAYTGTNACAPCDHSENTYQCVSPKESEKLQQKRIKKHGQILCDTCQKNEMSLVSYKCSCNEGICVKVAEAETYRNEEWGFEIKYPSGEIRVDVPQSETILDQRFYLYEINSQTDVPLITMIFTNDSPVVLNQYVEQIAQEERDFLAENPSAAPLTITVEAMSVGEENSVAKISQSGNTYGDRDIDVFIIDKTRLGMISYSYRKAVVDGPNGTELVEQEKNRYNLIQNILSTFKFIE